MAEDLLSYALITLADLETALNITVSTYDNLLTQCINDATMDIERRCFLRRLASATYTSERYDGNDQKGLYLRHYPITAVSSVTVDGTAVSAATTYNDYNKYWIEPNINGVKLEGVLYMTDKWSLGEQNVVVSYTGGYSTIPYDIRRAVIMMIKVWYNLALNDKGFKSETIGKYAYSFDPLPDKVEKAVDKLIQPYIPMAYL